MRYICFYDQYCGCSENIIVPLRDKRKNLKKATKQNLSFRRKKHLCMIKKN